MYTSGGMDESMVSLSSYGTSITKVHPAVHVSTYTPSWQLHGTHGQHTYGVVVP